MIELTTQQGQAIHDGQPVRALDPELGQEVVIVRADLFDLIKDLLLKEQPRQVIARIAMKNARARADEAP